MNPEMTPGLRVLARTFHFLLSAPARQPDFQSRRLTELVRHAYHRVPFYRRLYTLHGLNPADVRGIADLGRVPVASKSMMQEHPAADLVASGLDPARLVVHYTSGSTGYPFRIRRTLFEDRLLQGIRLKRQFQLGLRAGDLRVSVSLPGHGSKGSKQDTHFYNRLGLLRRLVVDCLLPAEQILERLAELRPDVLMGYPDALAWIAGSGSEDHLRRIRPRMVFTGGETLTTDMRRQISAAFEAPVYDFYGIHEFNLLASECPHTGLYHVAEDSAIVEVLKDGKPAAEGETGEVVATALHSFAMPMIRYWTGDLAVRGPLACPCGAGCATLKAIHGRLIDRFTLPGGRRLHPYHLLEPLVRDTAWLRRYQLVQETEERIVIKAVPLPGCRPGPEDLRRLRTSLQKPLGPDVALLIEMVNELPPAGTGKFRPYYSRVGGQNLPDSAPFSSIPHDW